MFPNYPVIEVGTSEHIKCQYTIDSIVNELLELGADRYSYLVGIGGGIVCDITGYVASIFMRGVRFGYVSTSLLSQVDASIGGKTGINVKGYKNVIGTFNQPDFVICDQTMLSTLPKEEIQNGMAEVIKHALIADKSMLEVIESNIHAISHLHQGVIDYLIDNSIRIKSSIVSADESEGGERKKLNLGHTFGHAIEKLSGVAHGRAVAIGLVKAAQLSAQYGYCSPELVPRIMSLLEKIGLPTVTELADTLLIEAIAKDKKKNKDCVDFVFLKEIGEVRIESIPITQLIPH
jgi:3-dehydroquinate synthase